MASPVVRTPLSPKRIHWANATAEITTRVSEINRRRMYAACHSLRLPSRPVSVETVVAPGVPEAGPSGTSNAVTIRAFHLSTNKPASAAVLRLLAVDDDRPPV